MSPSSRRLHERTCAVVPALSARATIASVVTGIRRHLETVLVVDDGSTDDTARVAEEAGARVVVHPQNRGKGAALRSGFEAAYDLGFSTVVTLDADGQHLPSEILKLLRCGDESALVIGVRDLARVGAPRSNQLSNAFANLYLSTVLGVPLRDTQCGMRRYPVARTLALEAKDDGFGFETEVLLRAVAARIRLVHVDIDVAYPESRQVHFNARRDPWRIVARVLSTLWLHPR
jgi:glycosyltransferase involved in cell wall biosynthesis